MTTQHYIFNGVILPERCDVHFEINLPEGAKMWLEGENQIQIIKLTCLKSKFIIDLTCSPKLRHLDVESFLFVA